MTRPTPEAVPDLPDLPDLHDGEGYTGPGELVLGGAAIPVHLDLRGAFQPIDGRFHWQGRVSGAEFDAPVDGTVILRTTYGEATGRVSDPDPWGRLRVTGTGTPPFPV